MAQQPSDTPDLLALAATTAPPPIQCRPHCAITAIASRLRTHAIPLMPKPPADYPPVSSIPKTTPARLHRPETPSSPTVFYLAYGSNLAAATFLGVRGIRPLSRVNVSAPTLDLTFDLPGVPYSEPCFANTALRKIPEKLPPNPLDPPRPTLPGPGDDEGNGNKWDKGLIGVVYEVTREDFATIIATEGGGASYLDIMVPCFTLPITMPTPANPEIPKPFLAHTLFTPNTPDKGKDGETLKTLPWYARLTRPGYRPAAQPSPRYLNLITSGAAEHDLPKDWQDHLNSMTPYTRTSRRQKFGQAVFMALFLPFMLLFIYVLPALLKMWQKLTGGENQGNMPPALRTLAAFMHNLVWVIYDGFGKNMFGDGEKTEEEKTPDEEHGSCVWQSWGQDRPNSGDVVYVDEKVALMPSN